jgi:hypothetical protein
MLRVPRMRRVRLASVSHQQAFGTTPGSTVAPGVNAGNEGGPASRLQPCRGRARTHARDDPVSTTLRCIPAAARAACDDRLGRRARVCVRDCARAAGASCDVHTRWVVPTFNRAHVQPCHAGVCWLLCMRVDVRAIVASRAVFDTPPRAVRGHHTRSSEWPVRAAARSMTITRGASCVYRIPHCSHVSQRPSTHAQQPRSRKRTLVGGEARAEHTATRPNSSVSTASNSSSTVYSSQFHGHPVG